MHWRRKWQPHSSVLAWRIPGMGEPGGLPSMGSHRVGHDWSDLAAAAAAAAAAVAVNPGGNQPWIFTGRTIAEAEAPILGPPEVKGWLVGKDPDAGKDWRQIKREQQNMRCLDSTTDSMDVNLSRLREIVEDRGAWRAAVHDAAKSQIWLSD